MNNTKKRPIFWLSLILAYILLLTPYFYTVYFSIPSADDFSMAYTAKIMNCNGNIFKSAFDIANKYYMSWGGEWVSFFLEILLNPLLIFAAPLKLYGFEMTVFLLIFIISVLVLMGCILKTIFYIDNIYFRVWIEFFVITIVIISNVYMQVFYWFVGSSYCWAICVTMFTLACVIWSTESSNKRVLLIAAALFGVIASNFLCMDILLGIIVLAMTVKICITDNTIRFDYCILLLLFVISGCIAAFAPGNFARFNGNAGSLNVLFALKHTALICLQETKLLFSNTILIMCLLIIFFSGLILGMRKEIKPINTVVLLALAAVSVYGSMLPVCIGYNGGEIPNRIQFVFDAPFAVFASMLALNIGASLGERLYRQKEQIEKWVAVCLATLGILCLFGYKNNAYYKTLKAMPDVSMESNAYKKIFNAIESSEDDDVVIVIEADSIPQTDVIKPPEVTGDAQNWVNISVAGYYDKDTVRFEWR